MLDALRLAQLSNLDIAQAREVVNLALAGRQRAWVAGLPNALGGGTYNDHEGQIQKTEGNVIDVNRNSLFLGGGPVLTVGLSDLLFGPGIAQRIVQAARAGEQRVTNDVFLAVADAYFAVLRAVRRLMRVEETLLYLTTEKPQPMTGDSRGLLPIIRAFVQQDQALPSDLARVEVEIVRRQDEGAQAVQELLVAMAELARLVRLDPTLMLWPLEDPTIETPLPGQLWLAEPLEELIAFARANRPEIEEHRQLVRASFGRLQNAEWRPFLPNLITTFSAGSFGGSPRIIGKDAKGNTIFGKDGRIDDVGGRHDWDISLLWRLNNLGFGNLAEIREQRALYNQAVLRALQTGDRVATQVVQSLESSQQTAERLRILRAGLFDDNGKRGGSAYRSLRLNFIRIKGGQGRPLEVLDSIRGLSDTLEAYANALTDNDRARFRLLIALGLPADTILDPERMPCPPGVNEKRLESADRSPETGREAGPIPPTTPVRKVRIKDVSMLPPSDAAARRGQ